MERIGIASSKLAKGNFLVYNLLVVVLSFVFSLFVFFIAGSSIVLALMIMSYIVNGVMPLEFKNHWGTTFYVCMITLTTLVSVLTLLAILRNIKFRK